MRWNDLFGDLEAQLDAAQAAEFDAEVSERAESERASVEFGSRLVASRGAEVTVSLAGGSRVRGRVADVTPQWVLVEDGGRQHLVPTSAIAFVGGVSPRAAEVSEVERRLPLGHALRALARDRVTVAVATTGGDCVGVIGPVGRDHLDLIQENGQAVAVPFALLVRVTST